MGLLGKNTYKRSFFYAKYQKYNQKVVLFIFFYVILHPYNKMQEYLHEHND